MTALQAHSSYSALQNMIRFNLAPALLLDTKCMVLQVNSTMAALLQCSPDALIGQSFEVFFPDGFPPELLPFFNFESEHSVTAEWIIAQVESPHLSVRIVRILGGFGGPVGFLVQAETLGAQSNIFDWEAALQGAGQGVWDFDISTGQKRYSRTWYNMRGLDEAGLIAEDEDVWLSKIHPDDLELTKKCTADLEAGLMRTVQYEYRERHPWGHWMWIMCRGQAIEWDQSGNPTRYTGTDTDITELKAAQQAVIQLNEYQIRWKSALESTEQGLWDINEEVGTRFQSHQWFRMRGMTDRVSHSSTFDEWLDRIHPDDVSQVLRCIELQSDSKSDSIKLEYRDWHEAGHWIWIQSRGRVVKRDDTGRPLRMIGFDSDISELKSTEDRIKRISTRLEMALTASSVGVWEFDLNTNHVEWDPVMREMYGLPQDSSPLPEDIWEKALHRDDREKIIATTTHAMAADIGYSLDYRIVRPDGTIRHIRSRASHIFDPIDGHKLLGLNWDVTPDFELAQKLKDAHGIALRNNAQLEAARKMMEHNSLHDALTGLPNRRMLDQVQKAKIDNPDARDKDFAVLHVDLDRFKQINDTHGHAAGDAALCHISEILRNTVSSKNLVARVGGDEFAIFIENSPPEADLVDLAKKIIGKAAVPMKYKHHDCRCGVSIGIALAKGSDIDENSLFVNADMAMYRSKSNGRGEVTVFNDAMKREAIEKSGRCDQLLAALEKNEFFCVYQPQYDCRTLEISGIEALVRWKNPVCGTVAPMDFLPLAEELQLIERIDKIVLHAALADLKVWQSHGFHVPRLSINISGRRLRDKGLAQELRDLTIPKDILSFEFLESIFLDEPDEVQLENINCIRELGIGIEVDDFGSGHSSIVSLLKLRPDRLKIDRSLVEPAARSERQRNLVQSIVDIGKLQGIKVLAEGVETEDHVRIMQSIGCDELQGYALSKPMTAIDLMHLLKQTEL